ncbi:hypothetical protein BXZ70DRAFT_565990 [Cristinia sonorae]|uniref:Uncharacterized protein n=1 Tax=Cristinia sonorae TaxID=1940300 RepID=A0A8K0UGI6_9AGAR|nr:hypothetical protein BXZ70DRAFT_565990 [Cristinia sonorae]
MAALLNWDILLYTLNFVEERDDIARLMRTNRTFYGPCLRWLLTSDIYIGTEWPKQVNSFCRFILNHPERAVQVRELSFWGSFLVYRPWQSRKEAAGELEKVLRLCTNLESIHIERSEPFFSFKELFMAVSECTSLKVISILAVGLRACRAISAMKCAIRCATISYEPEEGESPATTPLHLECEPYRMLHRFRQHLTEVNVISSYYREPMDVGLEFPLVDTLGVESENWVWDPLFFIKSFPNARVLNFVGQDPEESEAVSVARQHRLQRIADGLAVGSVPLPSWKSVDVLSCDVSRAYALALTCPVRLWEDVSLTTVPKIQEFQTVVEDIKPRHLSMSVKVPSFTLPQLTGIFTSEMVSLTHLAVIFDLIPRSLDPDSTLFISSDFDSFLDSIRIALQNLRLVQLVVMIQYDFVQVHFDTPSTSSAATPPTVTALARERMRHVAQQVDLLENVLSVMDVPAFADAIGESMPQIEHLSFHFTDEHQPVSSWSFVREGKEKGEGELLPLIPEVQSSQNVLRESPFLNYYLQ